jgi:hypothetical protein
MKFHHAVIILVSPLNLILDKSKAVEVDGKVPGNPTCSPGAGSNASVHQATNARE